MGGFRPVLLYRRRKKNRKKERVVSLIGSTGTGTVLASPLASLQTVPFCPIAAISGDVPVLTVGGLAKEFLVPG